MEAVLCALSRSAGDGRMEAVIRALSRYSSEGRMEADRLAHLL
jgi:hypothetical protein